MKWAGLLLFVSACGAGSEGAGSTWSLVGVYDATSLQRSGETADAPLAQFTWVQAPGMARSCGPSKGPDGMGVFEGEAMANGLSPVLAILLRRNGDGAEALTPAGVRVALGEGAPGFPLEPAVMPRYLSVRIEGDALLRYRQQVKTQLEMELCLEHKTGRGWVGGTARQLRQAFLLDPQDAGGIDRRFYGGQRDPVPALLGPPEGCIQRVDDGLGGVGAGNRGEGSLDLVPSDVWGASLRDCEVDEVGGAVHATLPPVPLVLGKTRSEPKRARVRQWKELQAVIHAGATDADIRFDLRYDGASLLEGHPLFAIPEGGGPPGTTDLLGRVPHTYPLVGTVADPDGYTVLLVPNWQIVEGLRRMNAGNDGEKSAEPMSSGGNGVQDGVGWLLAHPEHLFVQVPTGTVDQDGTEIWMNVAEPLAGGPGRLLNWGYIPGMLTGREPVAVVGTKEPTWAATMASHRAANHGLFLLSSIILTAMTLAGVGRLRDLFVSIPEERIVFWPGVPAAEEDQEGEVPEMPKAAG